MPPKTAASIYADAQKLEQAGDIEGAIKLYKSFLSKHRTHPNALKVRLRAAQLSIMTGKYVNAINLIEHLGAAAESDLLTMYTLAQANAYAGRLEAAHESLEKVLKIDPDYPPGIARLATIMQYEGQKQEAYTLVKDAMERGVSSWEIDHTLGELAPMADRVGEAADRIKARLEDQSIKGPARVELGFMLATLLERLGDHRGAWDAATNANNSKSGAGMGGYALENAQNRKINPSTKPDQLRYEKIVSIFTPELLRSLEPDDTGPEPRPEILMISGMPRSGTTLLEQILSAHPLAESAGEAPCLLQIAADLGMYPNPSDTIIPRLNTRKRTKLGSNLLSELHARSGGNRYVVDKHPSNDEQIGLLAAIAPGAKMIITRRDPRDVALSCFFRNFALGHGWTNTFETIVDMVEIRLKLHDYWMEVIPDNAPWIGLRTGDYEAIVRDPETQTRSLVEFAGLPWDDACLNFASRKRLVTTLQPHQAAKGVYTESLAKWAPYSECMGPSLDRLNAICERYGYTV